MRAGLSVAAAGVDAVAICVDPRSPASVAFFCAAAEGLPEGMRAVAVLRGAAGFGGVGGGAENYAAFISAVCGLQGGEGSKMSAAPHPLTPLPPLVAAAAASLMGNDPPTPLQPLRFQHCLGIPLVATADCLSQALPLLLESASCGTDTQAARSMAERGAAARIAEAQKWQAAAAALAAVAVGVGVVCATPRARGAAICAASAVSVWLRGACGAALEQMQRLRVGLL